MPAAQKKATRATAGQKAKRKSTGKTAGARPSKSATKPPDAGKDRNAYFRDWQQKRREAKRNIVIPEVKDAERKARCRDDFFDFARTYFGHLYTKPFSEDQTDRIKDVIATIRFGGYLARADERGDGKSMDVRTLLIWAAIYGHITFGVVVSATQDMANNSMLKTIKHELETNDVLAADFPEVCEPIRDLGGSPQKANQQHVDGERTRLEWTVDMIILPTINGSAASGVIIAARGLDSAIRGLNIRSKRPDIVIIDDAETRESANSETQITSRKQIIKHDIVGLGGQEGMVPCILLCTIINKKCVAAQLTDREMHPEWHGKRRRSLRSLPKKMDLVEEYIELRKAAMRSGTDRFAREADRFFIDKRVEIEDGAEVANPQRFDTRAMEDGEPKETCALHRILNAICDNGWDYFHCEMQNDPKDDEENINETKITPELVRSRLSHTEPMQLPDECGIFVGGIDVGKRGLHYSMIGWRSDFMGIMPFYGVQDTTNPDADGVEVAICRALDTFRDELGSQPYINDSGEVVEPQLIGIDAGNWQDAVMHWVNTCGDDRFKATKGVGEGQRSYRQFEPSRTSKNWKGHHWTAEKYPLGFLYNLDTDYWKRFVHARFMTKPGTPGSLSIYGSKSFDHTSFASHICAEIEDSKFIPGKGVRRVWREVRRQNHYFDATYIACAMTGLLGMKFADPYPTEPVTLGPNKPQRLPIARRDGGRPYLASRRR